jgi:hypothetical protein
MGLTSFSSGATSTTTRFPSGSEGVRVGVGHDAGNGIDPLLRCRVIAKGEIPLADLPEIFLGQGPLHTIPDLLAAPEEVVERIILRVVEEKPIPAGQGEPPWG